MPPSNSGPRAEHSSRAATALAAIAAVVVAVVAWHASLGVSPYDDSHYAAITLRLAQGAHPMADEWTLQVLGFALFSPFAKAWTMLFGTSGIALALRLAYVVLASVAWFFGYRALRPTFGSWPAALAVAAPLLVPPFGIFMGSYNTLAELGFVLAVCLGFAALRDASWKEAAFAGGALALAGCSYVPLAVAAIALLLVLTWLARRDASVLEALWLGAAAVAAVFALWLFTSASMQQIALALTYSRATWAEMIPPGSRIPSLLNQLGRAFVAPQSWALWALAVVAAIPWRRRVVGGVAAALIPVAAAVPGVWGLSTGAFKTFGTAGAAYLLWAALAMLPVVIVRCVRDRDRDTERMLVLGAAIALPAVPIVAYSTSAGWYWALPFVGAAALSVGVVLGWARVLADGGRPWLAAAGMAALALVLVAGQFAYTFDDGAPLLLTHRLASGPLAGLATSDANARQMEDVQRWASRNVLPGDKVLFLGGPLGYLLVGGQMDTNAVWLNTGQSDRYTVQYLETRGGWPRHVFVLEPAPRPDRPAGVLASDPLVAWVTRRYLRTGNVFEYEHFVHP